jgi:WD40 repeat protein
LVSSAAFSPDGKQVVSGSVDKTIRVWDGRTGEMQQVLKGHSNWVTSVAFSPDGKQVVSRSGDKTVRVWDIRTGQLKQVLEGHRKGVISVAFLSNGKQVVLGSWDVTIRPWDAVTLQVLPTLVGYSNWITSSSVPPDSKTYKVSKSGNWIKEGASNLLWLQHEYRATCEAVWKNTIALGHTSGRISILEFEGTPSRVD